MYIVVVVENKNGEQVPHFSSPNQTEPYRTLPNQTEPYHYYKYTKRIEIKK
jgi:hypothetical protein